ncbi:RNA exonuclease 3 [[Candida] jaroonii]|uniref:RNA exonuclease 3 n=1 Tax=[Candida] jaroonii TaxID=467808 RepID=A0ACA9Y3L4_9ASCO|nr:RNA exonuclease 3 [[Candida] jaroonii]
MFKHDDYFSRINCPKNNCQLINCIFKHPERDTVPDTLKSSSEPSSNVKRKIENDLPEPKKVHNEGFKPVHHVKIPSNDRLKNIKSIESIHKLDNTSSQQKEFELAIKSNSLKEYYSNMSVYLNIESDPQFITPKQLNISSPATLQVRKSNIENIYELIKLTEPNLKTPKLKAINEEYKIATTTSKFTYMPNIKRKIHELKNPEKYKIKTKELTNDDYYNELLKLVIPKDKLVKYGYIMDVPTPITPSEERKCRRCGKEFKLSDQLLPIHCQFHAGKAIKRDRKRVYECCGDVLGDNESEPCTSYNYHVFYWDNPGEMQSFLPFKITSDVFTRNENALKAIGIDCEMGFTTKGFELLRITAVDFFTGEEVLDVLVKPIGEVIDLNSRWSGIESIKDEALEFNESIKLLNDIMDSETVLIGHGLENDLNSMRLIHNRIVDTAILYPPHKTSPTFRYSLKMLVFNYLGKKIQTGQHDSGEDALGAIDIVKYFIKKDQTSILSK